MEKERVEEEEKGLGEGELVGEDCVKAVGCQDRSHKEEDGLRSDGLRSDGLTPSDSDEASKPADDTGSPSPDNTSSTGENDPIDWVQQQISVGVNPKELLVALVGPDCPLPDDADDILLWRLVIELLTQPSPRQRLPEVTTLEDVVHLIQSSSNIIVLSGAGISVSCGIPDFRSPMGIYARLSQEFPELPDPQAMFDIHYFRDDPRPFFRFAKAIYPGQFSPSASHRFISALEKKGKLLRNYTQNIDTLEAAAGISRVVYCHGSFSTATCCRCGLKVDAESIREEIFNQHVPQCRSCASRGEEGVIKPDIVFFGEGLPDTFHQQIQRDKDNADLLIVMGSSLKVRPVSLIPSLLPSSVPQVLINLEQLHHVSFDVELLGYSDGVVEELCRRLGKDWIEAPPTAQSGDPGVRSVGRVHLFPGAMVTESDLDLEEGGPDGNGESSASHGRPHEGNGCGDIPSEEESLPKRIKLQNDV